MIKNNLFNIALMVSVVALAGCSSGNRSNETTDSEPPPFDQPQKSAEIDDSIPSPKTTPAPQKTKGADPYQALKAAVRSANAEQIRDEAGKILSVNPNDPVALNTLALYYFRKSKFGAAKLLLARAFEKNPEVASLYNNLGVIELSEGDTAAAIINFKKALKIDRSHPAASANLGSLFVAGGEYSKSRPLLETAYRANKGNSVVANNYAITLRANKDYSKAAKVYEDVVKANPRDVNALLNNAILLIDFMNKPKDGLALVYKLKFLETENRDIIAQANALEKKAKAEIK